MYLTLHRWFQSLDDLDVWTPHTLAAHFGIPVKHFIEVAPGVLGVFHRWVSPAHAYLLRGSIFFTQPRYAVRGMPKIPFPPVYKSSSSLAIAAEQELQECLQDGQVWVEEKIDGVNIRAYAAGAQIRFATRFTLEGCGIAEGFDYGQIAREIAERRYPGIFDLVRRGDVPVFELISPRFEHLSLRATEEDLILTDVLRQHRFLPRREKEELARQYDLRLVRLVRWVNATHPRRKLLQILWNLEREADNRRIEGFIIKGVLADSDQVFLKIKAPWVRRKHWAEQGVPKRLVIESVRGVRDRLPLEEFIDPQTALPEIERELAEEIELDPKLRERIHACYRSERGKMLPHAQARRNAAKLIAVRKFRTPKEVLAGTPAEDTLLRHHLIDLLRRSD